MLELNYDYASCVTSSEKISWKLDDVMPPDARLDFGQPFLPSALAARGSLTFLRPDESRALNQITGNAYLNLFAFVEEYILATMIQHAQAEVFGDHQAIRALSRFVDEEVKHQQLFYRYLAAFRRDFGHDVEVLSSAAEVAGIILGKSPIAVMLITYHIEIMTQAHYTECVKDDAAIDPFFSKLLRFHWLEESQYARIDALELDKLLRDATTAQIETGLSDYIDLIGAFDGMLRQQAEMDARSLARCTGRVFDEASVKAIVDAQHAGYRYTFLVYGMKNASFINVYAPCRRMPSDVSPIGLLACRDRHERPCTSKAHERARPREGHGARHRRTAQGWAHVD